MPQTPLLGVGAGEAEASETDDADEAGEIGAAKKGSTGEKPSNEGCRALWNSTNVGEVWRTEG